MPRLSVGLSLSSFRAGKMGIWFDTQIQPIINEQLRCISADELGANMSLRFVLILVGTVSVTACSGGGAGSSPASSSSDVNAQAPLPPVGPGESLLQLAWQPNDAAVAGYRVYFGPTSEEATTQASDLGPNTMGFNAQAPAVIYNAQRDLGLIAGQIVCFRLRAYNDQGALSAWSTPVCGIA